MVAVVVLVLQLPQSAQCFSQSLSAIHTLISQHPVITSKVRYVVALLRSIITPREHAQGPTM